MATVTWGQSFGLSLHRLNDDVNPTLEYTAPYGLFGDQEIILIPLQGRDDEAGDKDKFWLRKSVLPSYPHFNIAFSRMGIARIKDG